MPDNRQSFADWLIEQRHLPITDPAKRENLNSFIETRMFGWLFDNRDIYLARRVQGLFGTMYGSSSSPQEIYEFGRIYINYFDDFLTEILQEFDERWGFEYHTQLLLIDLSEQPLCDVAWEFHEKVLDALPDDILTTTDFHVSFSATRELEEVFQPYIPLHAKDFRDGLLNHEGYGDHTCVFAVYGKWWHVLEEKTNRTHAYTGGKEPTEIQIIPPTRIVSCVRGVVPL
jgi:hypothetical protein